MLFKFAIFEKDLFRFVNNKCSQGYIGKSYCNECKNHAVLCDFVFCSCHKTHLNCEYFQNINALHENLNSKLIKDFNPNKILEATRNIANQIQKLEDQIKEQLTYFGLDEAEQEISKIIQEKAKPKNKITGQDLKRFKQKRMKQKDTRYQDSLFKFNHLLSISKINVFDSYKNLQELIMKQHIKFYQKKIELETLKSDIVKSQQDMKTLNNLVQIHDIKKIQKIFQSYEESTLNIRKVFEACEKRSPILFLIENQEGQKFGCYSQCFMEKNTITKNESSLSCFFSINSNFSSKSNAKNFQFHCSYVEGNYSWQKQKSINFEISNDQGKHIFSYLRLHEQIGFGKVINFCQILIDNGISQKFVKYHQVKKVEAFQIYFAKDSKNENLYIQKSKLFNQTNEKQRKVKENLDEIQKNKICKFEFQSSQKANLFGLSKQNVQKMQKNESSFSEAFNSRYSVEVESLSSNNSSKKSPKVGQIKKTPSIFFKFDTSEERVRSLFDKSPNNLFDKPLFDSQKAQSFSDLFKKPETNTTQRSFAPKNTKNTNITSQTPSIPN